MGVDSGRRDSRFSPGFIPVRNDIEHSFRRSFAQLQVVTVEAEVFLFNV